MKEGAKLFLPKREKSNQLQATSSWEMVLDFGRRLQFQDVVHTTPWSTKDWKTIKELMVSWEKCCEVAQQRKTIRASTKGWQTWLFPVEIGCGGFPVKPAWRLLSALGHEERSEKQAAHRTGGGGRMGLLLDLKQEQQPFSLAVSCFVLNI